jgi:hypothetical protein
LHERVRLPVRSVSTRVRAHPALVPHKAGRSPPHTHLRAAPPPPPQPPPLIETSVFLLLQFLNAPVIFFHIPTTWRYDRVSFFLDKAFFLTLSLKLSFTFFPSFFRFFFKFNKEKSMTCNKTVSSLMILSSITFYSVDFNTPFHLSFSVVCLLFFQPHLISKT